jgi:hypothetical protein
MGLEYGLTAFHGPFRMCKTTLNGLNCRVEDITEFANTSAACAEWGLHASFN